MLGLNQCYHFQIRLLNFVRSFNEIHRLPHTCKICASNYTNTSSAGITGIKADKSDSSNFKENYKTFGGLRKSLEYQQSRNQNLKNKRIIRLKARPSFRKENNPDVFGNLSDKQPMWYPDFLEESKIDNDQSDDSYMVRNISRQYRDPKVYLERMKTFVEGKNLKAALDLFVEMKRNHVVPIHAHFTFMIGACGRAGYTEMSFKLLRQMTDRGMEPTPATLTGLFNSCGECPFPEYGLRKARLLKEKISSKGWETGQKTYHAMIKAFGKCGDIQTAFQIVDEMATADIKIDVETFNFLLMSCISNKESGFTLAVEVLRKMKERKCIPDLFSRNLLLRAVRDCDIGPDEVSCLLLQHWSNYLKRPYGYKVKEKEAKQPLIQIKNLDNMNVKKDSDEHINKTIEESPSSEISQTTDNENIHFSLVDIEKTDKKLVLQCATPSVLGERPRGKSDVLDLGQIKSPSERLSLIGGAQNFLKEMKKDKVDPTIKTFTLLLECLPPSHEAENELISLLDIYNVTPDMGFFNILLKKRIFRYEKFAHKDILLLVNQWELSPDVITFGILSVGCRHYNQALNFLADLEKLGFCPNVEIVGALLSNACAIIDFKYLQHVLKLMEDEGIKPNEKILMKIEKTLKRAKKIIMDSEQGKKVSHHFEKENFAQLFNEFCKFYELWLQKMKYEKEENVWSQYKTEIVEKHIEEPCKIFPINK